MTKKQFDQALFKANYRVKYRQIIRLEACYGTILRGQDWVAKLESVDMTNRTVTVRNTPPLSHLPSEVINYTDIISVGPVNKVKFNK